jgi:uncharacterized GH25 family protein
MLMTRKIISALSLVAIYIICSAHEFWLQPRKFRYVPGEEMSVDFMVGENFEGEPWDLKKHKIEKLELHHLTRSTDLRALVKPDAKEKLKIKPTEAGTQLLVMQSDNAYIEMEAEKFNAYLQDDGLENVYGQRFKTKTLDKPSKEYYSRYVKLLVQVGNKTDDTFKQNAGLRLEIVPEQNPYALKTGDYLQCSVWYEGKRSPHQLIKVWNIIGHTSFLQNIYTENDGTIKFPISAPGRWMVSTVRMIPSEKEGADWQSMWGSLVFGIE